MKNTLLILSIAILSIVSCGSQHSDFATAPGFTESVMKTEAEEDRFYEKASEAKDAKIARQKNNLPASPPTTKQIEQKLIKTGYVNIEVENYKATRGKIIAAVRQNKGYISSDNEENSSYRTGSSMIIRVPKQNFDTLLNSITVLAKRVESKQVSLKDVTEEFVDIQARLKNKKQVEARYVEILKKAKTIKDILQVEEHLRKLREEIEAKEGRLKYLQSQVSYSTIHLQVYQKYTSSVYKPTFFGQLGDAVVGGWEGLKSFIIGLIYIWPFLLIFALIFWLVRKWIRKRKANKLN